MDLYTDFEKPLPKLPRPRLVNGKSLIQIEAEKLAVMFTGVAREPPPVPDLLAELRGKLGRNGGGLQQLTPRELRAVPYLIWDAASKATITLDFVSTYLKVVDRRWPQGLRSLWRHYLLNFDTKSLETNEFAAWFRERQGRLPELLLNFSRKYRVFEGEEGPVRLATALLTDDDLIVELETLGLTREMLRSSSFMVELLAHAGTLLNLGNGISDAPRRLSNALGNNAKDAIAEAICRDSLRDRSLKALIDGLVAWQQRQPEGDANIEPTLNFLVELNGDPRFSRERWAGRVTEKSLETVERWLSRATIESFFHVIDALRNDRPDMWKDRRAFWLSYLPHIKNAWLVVGPNAVRFAERAGLRFARFQSEGNVQRDHCALMLQIGQTCVMEMNKTGSAIFWHMGAKNLPGLFQPEYTRSLYLDSVDSKAVLKLTHNGDWQRKFKDQLFQMTGAYPR